MTAIKLFSLGDFGFLQFILRKISQVIMANTGFMMVSPSTRFDGPWFVVPNLPKEWEVHRQIFGNGRLLKQFQVMSLGSWLLGVYCLGFPWILWFFFKQGKEMTASSNPWEPKILKPQHLWKFCWENIRRFVRFFVTVEIAWYFFHHGSCKKWCLIAPSRWQPTKVNPAVATPPPSMARRSRRSWFPPIPQNKDASRFRNMYEKIKNRRWSENSTTPFENDNRHPRKELSNPLGILAQLLLAMGHSCPGYMEKLSFLSEWFHISDLLEYFFKHQ